MRKSGQHGVRPREIIGACEEIRKTPGRDDNQPTDNAAVRHTSQKVCRTAGDQGRLATRTHPDQAGPSRAKPGQTDVERRQAFATNPSSLAATMPLCLGNTRTV